VSAFLAPTTLPRSDLSVLDIFWFYVAWSATWSSENHRQNLKLASPFVINYSYLQQRDILTPLLHKMRITHADPLLRSFVN
jgi:hypothetical protein